MTENITINKYNENENIPPVRDYYKWLKISKDATHDEIFEAIMKVKEKCGYDEDNPMPAFWESDRAPLKWKDIRDARILLDPDKRAEYDKKLEAYQRSKQKIVTFNADAIDGLAAQTEKRKIEKTKKRIASNYNKAIRNILIVLSIVAVIFVPWVRNGILGVLNTLKAQGIIVNPITFILGFIVFGSLAYVLIFVGFHIIKFITEPIMDAIYEHKKLKGSNQYNK